MNSSEEGFKNGAALDPEFDRARANQHFRREPDHQVDLLQLYARVLLHWPKTIVLSMVVIAAITGVASKSFLTKWYKATAIIRPVSQSAIQEQIEGLMSAFGTGGGTGMSSLLGSITGGNDADEYVGILKSFTFTREVIRRHNLMVDFLFPDNPSIAQFNSSRHLQWRAYRALKGRMNCEYSMKTGNITIEFQDTDPARAEVVVGYILDDFGELLRRKQIHDVKAAVKSLNEAAAKTSDTIIQGQLYQLIANQIQRETLAKVQADFAFTTIEAPSASDVKVWPPTMLFSLLAALGTFVLVAACILFIHPSPLGPRPALALPDKAEDSLERGYRKRAPIPDGAQRPQP